MLNIRTLDSKLIDFFIIIVLESIHICIYVQTWNITIDVETMLFYILNTHGNKSQIK